MGLTEPILLILTFFIFKEVKRTFYRTFCEYISDNNIDILAITEKWLKEGDVVSYLSPLITSYFVASVAHRA